MAFWNQTTAKLSLKYKMDDRVFSFTMEGLTCDDSRRAAMKDGVSMERCGAAMAMLQEQQETITTVHSIFGDIIVGFPSQSLTSL